MTPREGNAITIDVKAVAGKNDWLLGDSPFHTAPNHFVVLVSYEGAFADLNTIPRTWIFSSSDLVPLIKVASNGKTHYVPRKVIMEQGQEHESAWFTFGNAVAP